MKPIAKLMSLTVIVVMALLLTVPVAAQEEYVRPSWDGQSRFTVLLMGLDRRPSEQKSLTYRADAIMVVSFEPATNSIGVLSIPRDMNFALPDVNGELVPVNTLLVRGESREEGYGPIYMMDTIQYNLGIYIDTYVLFDFEAFVSIVDALGGVEVDVPYNISDPQYPAFDSSGFDPFNIRRGLHLLDGRTALKYARTRHGDNDYLRGQRQIQVVEAIRARISEPGVLPDLLPQAPNLLADLSENVYTDIAIDEMIQLAQTALNVPSENIFTGALNEEYSLPVGTSRGSVRIPNREKLAGLMVDVFGENYAG